MKHKRNTNEGDKKNINPVMAAVAGAVVGSAAVAGTILMADKKNQAKLKKVVGNVKDDLAEKKELLVKKVNKLGDITKNKVKDVKKV